MKYLCFFRLSIISFYALISVKKCGTKLFKSWEASLKALENIENPLSPITLYQLITIIVDIIDYFII